MIFSFVSETALDSLAINTVVSLWYSARGVENTNNNNYY